nr:hypothetical protein [uncultured Actinoplanes sp.]
MPDLAVGYFRLEHLVCEVGRPGDPPGYLWYELDWDDPAVVAANEAVAPAGSARVIAATRRGPHATVREVVPSIGPATHVQFEVPRSAEGRTAVAAIRDSGRTPVPALHLTATPAGPGELRNRVEALAELGTDLIKLVFPAPRLEHIRWAEALLDNWPQRSVGLSLTPAGGRQGRVAAALAGSRLVFAPLSATAERMPASWYRALAVSASVGADAA